VKKKEDGGDQLNNQGSTSNSSLKGFSVDFFL
jgi:hypothetical protein